MYKSLVYRGDDLIGDVEIYPQNQNQKLYQKIRISHISQSSERCSPIAVLHTITGVCFKMESPKSQPMLSLLHSTCLRENKTAVVPLGSMELHLVAMRSRTNEKQYPCFWGFNIPSGLYNSCLVMLNLRCLGIVFDLDETLVVANTMRSFEDKIDALQRKINTEADPKRISGMLAEVKRYQEDKALLKQYADNDQVVENGKVIKIQTEVVPASDNVQHVLRPIIRLQEKNIILTRINPLIRDTSVLVRLRPAWEDLRSYLTARGRKRFEVFVCTMAEKDYALEMWRLLDPESNLISPNELLERIVCVKSGLRKSLYNVFQSGNCHPKMALIIDDRLKVWDEEDQPRVHVVPAFAPYYAPQAEENNTVPVLCLARNVACNVRGGFFKDFDDGLLKQISDILYEDDVKDIMSPPDVSDYLVSEDDASATNNKDSVFLNGMIDTEVERRLKDSNLASSTIPSAVANVESRLASLHHAMISSSDLFQPQTSQWSTVPISNSSKPSVLVAPLESSLQKISPAREEGEVPESELDPDTRRRLLILQHGQHNNAKALTEPPCPLRPPMQASPPQPTQAPLFFHSVENSIHADKFLHENPKVPIVGHLRDDRLRFNQLPPSFPSYSGEEAPMDRLNPMNRNLEVELGQGVSYAATPVRFLFDIAMKCGTKVEFRPALVASLQLQFSMEVWFAGEKVGGGVGRSRKEALSLAAENALKNLANQYLSKVTPGSNSMHGGVNRFHNANDNGFLRDVKSNGYQLSQKEDFLSFSRPLDPFEVQDPRLEGPNRMMGPVSALKEQCMKEGLGVVFQAQSPLSSSSIQKDEVHAQVEIDGQVLGKGVGLTWDEAKMHAAEMALGSLKSMPGQYTQKRQGSPRASFQGMPSKRLKQEFPQVSQRIPFARYPTNPSLMP